MKTKSCEITVSPSEYSKEQIFFHIKMGGATIYEMFTKQEMQQLINELLPLIMTTEKEPA